MIGFDGRPLSKDFKRLLLAAMRFLTPTEAAALRTLIGALSAGPITTSGLTEATGTILGRITGGTGAIEQLTATQVTALINAATTALKGAVVLASSAEAIAGTDTAKAITPATLFAGLNATGSAPMFACRAWVNFNGTGTVAIRASGNVSSITDNGTADYTVNFATALPDANYAPVVTHSPDYGIAQNQGVGAFSNTGLTETAPTTSAFRFFTRSSANYFDSKYVCVAVFR